MTFEIDAREGRLLKLDVMPDEHFITAAEVSLQQNSGSVRNSSCIARLDKRWRVGANDNITSDIYERAQSP